jgi:hypothetical protein
MIKFCEGQESLAQNKSSSIFTLCYCEIVLVVIGIFDSNSVKPTGIDKRKEQRHLIF